MKRKADTNETLTKKTKNNKNAPSADVKIIFDDNVFDVKRENLLGYDYFERLLSDPNKTSIKIPNRSSAYFQYILDFLDCCLMYENLREEEEDIEELKEEAKFYGIDHLYDILVDMQFSMLEFDGQIPFCGIVQATSIKSSDKIASGVLDLVIDPSKVKNVSDKYRYYFEFKIIGDLTGFDIGFFSDAKIRESKTYGCKVPLLGGGVLGIWYDFESSRFVVYVNRKFCSEKPLAEWKTKSCKPMIGATFSRSGKVEYLRNAIHPSAPKRDNIFGDLSDLSDYDE